MSKRKMLKKGMAYASAAIMLAGSMPMTAVNAFAAETDVSYIAVQADNQTASGKWGTCEWTIDNGVLTIGGGVGTSTYSCPWIDYAGSVKKITIKDKITFKYNGQSLKNLFNGMSKVESIEGLSNIEAIRIDDMTGMFANCTSLTKLDLKGFNTSQVNYMSQMFWECSSLTELDLSGFETFQVDDMSAMFSGCKNLKSLDLSKFNTWKVKNMENMFWAAVD